MLSWSLGGSHWKTAWLAARPKAIVNSPDIVADLWEAARPKASTEIYLDDLWLPIRRMLESSEKRLTCCKAKRDCQFAWCWRWYLRSCEDPVGQYVCTICLLNRVSLPLFLTYTNHVEKPGCKLNVSWTLFSNLIGLCFPENHEESWHVSPVGQYVCTICLLNRGL
jgi:hypothetical protein